jgi:hypothetical protein
MYSIIHAFHIFSGLILGRLPLFLATECRSCRPGKRAPLNRFWGQIRCRGTCGVNAQSTRCDRHFPVNWCGWLWTWVLKKNVFRHSFCVLTFFTSQVSPRSSCTSPFSSRVAGADRLPSFQKTAFFETQGCFNPTDSCWTIAMTMIVIGFTIRYSYCKL